MSVAQAFRAAPKMGRLRTHAPAIAMQVKKSGNSDARVPTAEESRKKNPTGMPIAYKFKVRVRVRVRVRVSVRVRVRVRFRVRARFRVS